MTDATKTDSTRSAALGIPFELDWATPEAELRKLLAGERATVNDQDRAKVEAMIVDPTWRKEVYLAPPIAHAAALLLRNPLAPVVMDAELAAHLDDPHVQAVAPLLDTDGKRRLVSIRALAGRELGADDRRAITADAVTVWARSSRKLGLVTPSLSADAPYARLVEVVERYGDPRALPAELQALWREGRAKTVDHLEAELATDLATFAPAALANPRAAVTAFAHRHASPRFATDAPDDVHAFLDPIIAAAPPSDWNAQLAARAALAYGVLVLARAGRPLPDVASRIVDGRILSPLYAQAGVALGVKTSTAPEYAAWVAALAEQWSELPARIADAARAKASEPDLALIAAYAAAHVPDDQAEALALALRGLGWGSDRAAFSILFRLRDAGRVTESAAWFDYASRTGRDYDIDGELRRALTGYSPALRRGLVDGWLASGAHLAAAGDVAPERAITAAILRGDVKALTALATEEREALVQGLLEQHIAASTNADALVQAFRYRVPPDVAARLAELVKRDETALQRLQRLVAAAPGTKRDFVFLVESTQLGGLAAHATPARSRIRVAGDDVVSVHLDDCPELKARFPGAASIAVFASEGTPSRVPARIVANAPGSAEHHALEAAPPIPTYSLQVLRLSLPEDILGRPGIGGATNDLTEHRVIADLLPYAAFVLAPAYAFVRGEQPVVTITDPVMVRGGEGDEGRLLVFASGHSYCEYAGSGW